MRRSIAGLVLMALLVASGLGGFPAKGFADEPAALTPKDVYARAMAKMRTFEAPPYVEYDSKEKFLIGSKAFAMVEHILYRQRDGMAHMQRTSNGVPDRRANTGIIPAAPTIFMLGHGSTPAPDATPEGAGSPRIIISVVATPERYTLTVGAKEAVPGCSDPVHLLLVPLSDPLRYNLRELWIDSSTFRICRAVVAARMTYYFAHPVGQVIADVDAQGHVYHTVSTATAHTLFVPTTLWLETTFLNIVPLESVASDAFERK